jgi:predicted Zn finger-like uncharacterized protein
MIIVCPSCQAKYKFDETKLGDRPKAKSRCAKCGSTIEIENPLLGAFTLPPGSPSPAAPPPPEPPPPVPEVMQTKRTMVVEPATPAPQEFGGATVSGKDAHRMGLIELPRDKRFSLAVIQGEATGQIYPITKSRMTIGRSGADINLDDPEASRSHAALEIVGDTAILRDLGSTNGTFIDLDRIDQHQLGNQMEFRIGSHVLMFIVTDVD